MNKKKQEIIPLVLDTYLAVIKNSLGSTMFRNFYAEVDGKRTDIMRDGELSCAFYVSSVIVLFKLISGIHGTVDSTVKDLKESGWEEIKKPKVGSMLVWEKMDFGDNDPHKHIGFFVGDDKAISNSYTLGYPVEHSWDFDSKRKVEMILWNPKLK